MRRQALGLAALLMMLAGSLAFGPGVASGAERKAAPTPTWATYFYPQAVGWSCEDGFTSPTASGSETLRVASVTATPKGKEINVTQSGSSKVDGKDVPSNASLHFTITKSGELINEPSNVLIIGVGVHTVGNTIYPSVKKLLAGGTGQSHVAEYIPLSGTLLAQIKSVLKPNQTSLKVSLEMSERGTSVSSLTVPMGTYHHVLEVKTSVRSVNITNALRDGAKELNTAFKKVINKTVDITTWYAPNVGPIQATTYGITTKASLCL